MDILPYIEHFYYKVEYFRLPWQLHDDKLTLITFTALLHLCVCQLPVSCAIIYTQTFHTWYNFKAFEFTVCVDSIHVINMWTLHASENVTAVDEYFNADEIVGHVPHKMFCSIYI